MNSEIDNYEFIFCADDEYFVKFVINFVSEDFVKIILNQELTNNNYKRQRLNNTNKKNLKLIFFIQLNVYNNCY